MISARSLLAFVAMFALTMAAPAAEPRLKPKPNPLTTMVSNRMDLIRLTTEDTLAQVDTTTEEMDTMDSINTMDTMDSTMDSTTDSTTDSTMDSTTDSTDSKPKAGNYRFTSIYRVTKPS